MESTKETVYCSNAVLNAVFAYFMNKAEQNAIPTELQIAVPADFDLNVTELSVVIANVFENAINANLNLPKEKRFIKCQSVATPQFGFRISNPFEGKVLFQDNGLPKTDRLGHGTGIHSVTAFCEKYDVYYEFKVENGLFIFSMLK